MAAFNADGSKLAADVTACTELDRLRGEALADVDAGVAGSDDASALLWWSLGAWHKPHQHQQPIHCYGIETSSTHRSKHHQRQLQQQQQHQHQPHSNAGDGRRPAGATGTYGQHTWLPAAPTLQGSLVSYLACDLHVVRGRFLVPSIYVLCLTYWKGSAYIAGLETTCGCMVL